MRFATSICLVLTLATVLGTGCADDQVVGSLHDAGVRTRTGPYDECGNGMDDDGDGLVDENCPCGGGETQSCFSGMYPNRHIGACADGVQACDASSSTEFGYWGACTMDVLPDVEACDGVDNNCDGAIDEGCSCALGETRVCGSAFSTAPCAPGTQRCGPDSTWSACEGAIGPSAEVCGAGAGDGIDNDCDGVADEGCSCAPIPEVCADGLDNDCDGTVDEAACTAPGEDCGGVDCNVGGLCAIADGEPVCVCGPGFHAVGRTTCASDGSVSSGCENAADCPGELCDYLTGRCVPETASLCTLPPAVSGDRLEGSSCGYTIRPAGRVDQVCAPGLVCVSWERRYDPTSGEYVMSLEEFRGACQPACNPCEGCGAGSCLSLPEGGGVCLDGDLNTAGEPCDGSWGPRGACVAGTTCPGGGGAGETCVRYCRPDNTAYGMDNATGSASLSADCHSDEICVLKQGLVFSAEGNLFICQPGHLVREGDACGPFGAACDYPIRCLNGNIPGGGATAVPGVCSRELARCESGSCPSGTNCRDTDWGAGVSHVCIGEHALPGGAVCSADLDCEVGLTCEPHPSATDVSTCQ